MGIFVTGFYADFASLKERVFARVRIWQLETALWQVGDLGRPSRTISSATPASTTVIWCAARHAKIAKQTRHYCCILRAGEGIVHPKRIFAKPLEVEAAEGEQLC